ncbi:hypothetical protein LIHA111178_00080 [Litorimonas haliclonae]
MKHKPLIEWVYSNGYARINTISGAATIIILVSVVTIGLIFT